MHTKLDTETAVADWLASALQFPTTAHAQWANRDIGGVALLPLGRRFDAVRMPIEVVNAAAGSDDWSVVAAHLAAELDGPVIADPFTWIYALVPPQTTETWRSPVAGCRGRGAWLGVPPTDRTVPARGMFWAVPMARAGVLCSPDKVADLLVCGHARLTDRASR